VPGRWARGGKSSTPRRIEGLLVSRKAEARFVVFLSTPQAIEALALLWTMPKRFRGSQRAFEPAISQGSLPGRGWLATSIRNERTYFPGKQGGALLLKTLVTIPPSLRFYTVRLRGEISRSPFDQRGGACRLSVEARIEEADSDP